MAGHAFLSSTIQSARITAGTQDFTVTGIGTPKGILVIMSGGNTDGSVSNTAGLTIGFSDGTTQTCIGIRSLDNQADSETSRAFDFTAVVHLPNPAGTGTTMRATFDSWITDGVRLNVVTADSDYYIQVIFFCGSDIQCKVGNFDMSDHTGTPNQTLDVTGVGFDPNLAFFLGCVEIAGLSTSTSNVTQNAAYSFGIGCLDSSSVVKTAITAFTHRDARTTAQPSFHSGQGTQGRIYTGFAGAASGSLTHVGPVNLDSFITGGFRVKDVPGGNPPVVAYMAVSMSDREMELVSVDADPAGSSFTVAVTQPGSAIVLSTSADALGDKTDSQATGLCYGAYTQNGQHSVAFFDQDAVSTMNTGSAASIDIVIFNPEHDGTAGLEYNASHDDTDFTFTEAVNIYGTSRKQLVLAIQRPSFNGTGAGNFPLLTASGAGTIPYIGSGAGILPFLQGGGAADLVFTGSAAGSMPLAAGDGSADLIFTGSSAGALPLLAGDGSADLVFTGTSAGVLPLAAGDGSADLVFTGSAAGTFALLAGDGSADLVFTGTSAGALPILQGDGSADLVFTGTSAGSLPLPQGDADADLVFTGAAAGDLPLMQGDGSGTADVVITGSAAGVLPLLQGGGSADLVFQGSSAGVLPLMQGDGSGTADVVITGTSAGVLPLPTGVGLGYLVFRGSSAGVLPLLLGSGSGANGDLLGCTSDLLGSSDLVAELEGSRAIVGTLLGSRDMITELEGSYALAGELEGSYDVVTELEGGVC